MYNKRYYIKNKKMYKSNNKTESSQRKKQLFFFAVLALILFIVFLVFSTNIFSLKNQNSDSSSEDENSINFDPPIETEQNAGNDQKEEIVNQEEIEQKPQTDTSVEVVIVDSTQYGSEIEVRAFASNIVKDGVCKITFSKDTASFSREVPAKADASTTPCLTLDVPRSEFNFSGTWQVEVQYTNEDASGITKSTVEVL